MANPLYPQDLDYFREYLDGVTDHLFAQDLNDYFSVAIKIQNELGVKPSGNKGTVWARLFENGNLALASVFSGWRPLKWDEALSVNPCSGFARDGTGLAVSVNFNKSQFEGQDTVFGDDTPCVFAQLQWPIDATGGAQGPNGRGGTPWRHAMSALDDGKVAWVAMDGEGNEMTVLGGGQTCVWGYLIWNLVTGGDTQPA